MPEQPLIVGVTVIVEVIFEMPGLLEVIVLVLVHANVAPAGVLVKAVAATVAPEHTVIAAGTATVGVGSTTTR